MPKAFRIALPAYGNEVVFLLQATSLVSTITLLDLTGVARRVIAQTFAVYEVFIAAAIIYLVMVYALVFLFRWVEKRLNPVR
jgi:octopine/nopaline transport system permease protein/arginine/ornithine transport system permease protein